MRGLSLLGQELTHRIHLFRRLRAGQFVSWDVIHSPYPLWEKEQQGINSVIGVKSRQTSMASCFWELSGLPHRHCRCCPLPRVPSAHAYLARTSEENRFVCRRTCLSLFQHCSAQAGNQPTPASPLWTLTGQSNKKMVNSNSSGWNGQENFVSVVASASHWIYLSETARRAKCGMAAYQRCYSATGFLHFPPRLEGPGH